MKYLRLGVCAHSRESKAKRLSWAVSPPNAPRMASQWRGSMLEALSTTTWTTRSGRSTRAAQLTTGTAKK